MRAWLVDIALALGVALTAVGVLWRAEHGLKWR